MKSLLSLAAVFAALLVSTVVAKPAESSPGLSEFRSPSRQRRSHPDDLPTVEEPASSENPFEASVAPVLDASAILEHRGRHGNDKLSRDRRASGIYELLSRAGQWSYYLFQYFLPHLDCANLKARAADPSVGVQIAQACRGLGLQQHCDDINQKRQLPRTNPDYNCDVRTLAQAVYDSCCVYKPQKPASTRASQAPPTPPIRHAPACGRYRMRPLPRVVNGVPAAKCEFPWVAGLFKYGTIVNCGASVVSDRFVVTASHCVQEQAWAYRVQAGKHFLDSSRDSTLQSRGVARIIRHPDYSSNGIELDDIALLELDAPLALNECVQPICLPQSGQSPLPFQDCTVAGWGLNSTNAFSATQPESLQRVDLTVYSAHACRQTFGKDSSLVRDTMLCAANGLVGGKDACTGDSGGPLMCLHNNSWTLFGIVSMGYGCALPGEPGYYTAVAHYRSWLDSYLNQRRFSG